MKRVMFNTIIYVKDYIIFFKKVFILRTTNNLKKLLNVIFCKREDVFTISKL